MTKAVLLVVALVLGVILVALGGGLLVLLAYGVGLVLNPIMHFDPFQATALSLAGISVASLAAVQLVLGFVSVPSLVASGDEDDEWDEDEWDEAEIDKGDEDAGEAEKPQPNAYPRIPRWRQPLKETDFSKAQPDDRCPCGSGRKFKNCHGRNRTA